jgi:hypothetical protein
MYVNNIDNISIIYLINNKGRDYLRGWNENGKPPSDLKES